MLIGGFGLELVFLFGVSRCLLMVVQLNVLVFKGGLKQMEPLTPFLLMAEGLSGLFSRAIELDLLFRFKV